MDKTLKTLIPLIMLQGKVKIVLITQQMFSNLVPIGELPEPYTLVKLGCTAPACFCALWKSARGCALVL